MISGWLIGTSLTAAAVVFSFAGVYLVRRRFPALIWKDGNDVAGPIYSVLGVVYAVILAFVVIVVWEQFNSAESTANNEATQIVTIYRDIMLFPDSIRVPIRRSLLEYARSVITEEWTADDRAEVGSRALAAYDRLWADFTTIRPSSQLEEIWLNQLLQRLNTLEDMRSLRLLDRESSVPRLMWILLIAGGVLTIGFAMFFSTERTLPLALMVSALSATIVFALFLIVEIDHPFVGAVRVEPEAFEHAIAAMEGRRPMPGSQSR
jgi:hypothetical protein